MAHPTQKCLGQSQNRLENPNDDFYYFDVDLYKYLNQFKRNKNDKNNLPHNTHTDSKRSLWVSPIVEKKTCFFWLKLKKKYVFHICI